MKSGCPSPGQNVVMSLPHSPPYTPFLTAPQKDLHVPFTESTLNNLSSCLRDKGLTVGLRLAPNF